MNNFEQLVYSLIMENQPPPAPATNTSNSGADASNNSSTTVEDLIVDPEQIAKLLPDGYFNKFDYIPDKNDCALVKNAWYAAYTRPNAAPFKDIGYLLPIICLTFMILKRHDPDQSGNSMKAFTAKIDTAIIEKIKTDFKTIIDNVKTKNAIDINPADLPAPIANIQRQIKAAVGASVGQLTLSKCNDYSIRDALYYLLAARKEVRKKTLKVKNVPDAGKAVEAVLREPKRFAGGQKMFDPKLSTIYTSPVEKEILDISIAAHKYYESEKQRSKPQPQNNEEEDVELFCQTTLWDFLTNKITGSDFVFIWIDKNNQKVQRQTDIGAKGYNIQNIQGQTKSNNEPAKFLYRELEDFANYIRKQEPFDWVGALKNTAAGLKGVESALGIKM